MNCTCFKRQYPCPIHGDDHLPQVDDYIDTTIVIHLHAVWADGKIKFYTTVAYDAIRKFTHPVVDTKDEALGGIQL